MKKGLAVIAAALVLLAACGKEGGQGGALTAGESAAPTASTDAKASVAPKTKASPGTAGATAAAATSAPSAAKTSAPAAKAPAGKSNRPKDGTYVYSFKGKSTNPFDPTAAPQEFDGELTNELTHSGDIYTVESTNTESPGRTTVRTKWTSTNVQMLSLKNETPGGDFSCTFNPPLIITKFPIKPETFPTQQIKGEGNACDGTLDLTVVRMEPATDGKGKSWSTWQVKIKLTIKSDQLSLTQNETRWVAPDIGAQIKSDGKTDGTFGPQKFSSTSTTLLKSYP